jgi:GH24 family phage-related lysozyme (muramidase)
MANSASITLEQLFRYYKALPHQSAAIQELEADLKQLGYLDAMRRDRPWFQTWSQDGKQSDLAAGLALVKEFEGCRLSAYPDPASGGDPWTIGYGSTRYPDGRPVKRGDKGTVVEADLMLRREIDRICQKLAGTIPAWNEMGDNQKSALISFAYNLGDGFYGGANFNTISKALREKRWHDVPAAMMLYRNPGSNVEAGLKRRRKAEGDLWMKDMPEMPAETFQAVRLNVPYFSQRDNKSGTGYRECFSSSCAMVAAYFGKVTSDDQYNLIRAKYGDTTEQASQIKALTELGLKAQFLQSGTAAILEREIRSNRPVAVGWLHHGTAAAPSGGGHWSVVIGFDKDAFYLNDPYGEADLVNGGYINSNGKGVRYSRKNWLRRWEVEGPGSGWLVLVSK